MIVRDRFGKNYGEKLQKIALFWRNSPSMRVCACQPDSQFFWPQMNGFWGPNECSKFFYFFLFLPPRAMSNMKQSFLARLTRNRAVMERGESVIWEINIMPLQSFCSPLNSLSIIRQQGNALPPRINNCRSLNLNSMFTAHAFAEFYFCGGLHWLGLCCAARSLSLDDLRLCD